MHLGNTQVRGMAYNLGALGNPLATESAPVCESGYEAKVMSPGNGIAPFWQCVPTVEASAQWDKEYKAQNLAQAKTNCGKEWPLWLATAAVVYALPGWWKLLPIVGGLAYGTLTALSSTSRKGCPYLLTSAFTDRTA